MVELKGTMAYSFFHLISLRMLYTSVASMLLNLLGLLFILPVSGHAVNIALSGASGTFLLSLLTLAGYRRNGSHWRTVLLLVLWIALCVLLIRFGQPLYRIFTETIPAIVHGIVTWNLLYLRRNRKRDIKPT